MEVKRGDIWLADLGENTKNIQGGIRAIVITSNDKANMHSPIIDGSPLTSRSKNALPVHVIICQNEGVLQDSTIMIEQDRPINKNDLIRKLAVCPNHIMKEIDKAILIQKGLISPFINISKINELKNKINECDKYIDYYKKQGINYDEELMNKAFFIAELKSYCDIYNVDYKKFVQHDFNQNKVRMVL